jgi:hypothetical protein
MTMTEEQDRDRRIEDARACFAGLAANMLRMMRGAGGNPKVLKKQAEALAEAIGNLRTPGYLGDPSSAVVGLTDVLKCRVEQNERYYKGGEYDSHVAYQQITSGAFQMVASLLLGSPSQATKARGEISDGVRSFERAAEKARAALE